MKIQLGNPFEIFSVYFIEKSIYYILVYTSSKKSNHLLPPVLLKYIMGNTYRERGCDCPAYVI